MAQIGLPVMTRFGRFLSDTTVKIYNNGRSLNVIAAPIYNRSAVWKNNRTYSTTNTTNSSKQDASQDPIPESAESSEQTKQASPEVEALLKDISTIKESLATYEDKYKRALAESENVRRRMTKQVEEAKAFGIQSFCKDLLDVADTLSKAVDSVPANELSSCDPQLKALHSGVVLTFAQMQQVFSRHGLTPLDPIDRKFDPNMHEALFQQQVEGKETGTVIVVSKIGYKLHERCLRPALVGVAK